jgi:uncharacterized membrane protein
MTQPPVQSRWIILALASGAFAALNGLFAKLYVYLAATRVVKQIAR